MHSSSKLETNRAATRKITKKLGKNMYYKH